MRRPPIGGCCIVKEFGKVGVAIEGAIKTYAEDLRSRAFPGAENTYEVED